MIIIIFNIIIIIIVITINAGDDGLGDGGRGDYEGVGEVLSKERHWRARSAILQSPFKVCLCACICGV